MLRIESIVKSFGGVKALDKVTMEIGKGQIHGVIGPNGAGKSTLFRIVSGTLKPDLGEVIFHGKDITGFPSYRTSRLGIGYVFQESFLYADMTLFENMMVSGATNLNHGVLSLIPGYQLKQEKALKHKIASVLKEFNLQDKSDFLPNTLSYGDRRRALIAHILVNEASLLLLDEPSAGMNPQERQKLTEDIRRIRDKGHTILIIEHNLRLIMGICDKISVLNFGRMICGGSAEAVVNNRDVIEAYIGKKHESIGAAVYRES